MPQDAMRSYTRGWGVGSAIKEIAAAISHTHVHTRGEGSGRGPLHEVAAGPLITTGRRNFPANNKESFFNLNALDARVSVTFLANHFILFYFLF